MTSLQGSVMSNTIRQRKQVEVISFVKGMHQATVVTDGRAVKSFTETESRNHQSTRAAIAHLEALGYRLSDNQLW